MSIFRIVVVLAVCLFGAYSSFSETKKLGDYVVWLKTTKPEAIYKVGDKAEFEIKIFKDGKPFDGAELFVSTRLLSVSEAPPVDMPF